MIQRLLCIISILSLSFGIQAQEHWPQWRGPNQNGVSTSTNLPTSWNLEKNLVWKSKLPSWSGGTPVIWGNHIFLTSPSPALTEAEKEPGGNELYILCLSKTDGKELWRVKLDEGNRLWRKHNNTSPSPVTDGKHVWVITGTGQVTALTMAGKVVWTRNLQDDHGEFGLNWGYGASPLYDDGKLIVPVLHGMHTDNPSYILALDGLTGKPIWRQERATNARRESPDAYTTPTLLKHNGQTQIVITGGDVVTGHNPKTGKEIWRANGLNPENSGSYRIVASPLAIDGMIYAPTRKRPLLALPAGGTGDVTNSVLWKFDGAGAPDVPTPVSDGKHFYMVDDRGLATCLNAKTGEVIWGPERTAQGTVSASPILADGKLYVLNEYAVTTVLS
ncbi:MAG: PQQ-like beta-propeller repeat protein, partial [Candidatus Latescibacteria bacterium]|nr:PQQ-like beta-propeller repeat protein [Candidatus Latescibacterota bacterium]